MGSLIGGAIGLAGSLIGGGSKKSAANTAAQQSLEGYNYLTKGGGAPVVQAAQNAGTAAGNAQAVTQDTRAQLLGTAPIQEGTKNAFTNYLNSTGYQFQLDQGTKALTGSAAARGILNSGATAKALNKYGQGLASTTFNNYLDQLGGLDTSQGNTAARGVTAAQIVGQAGTTGGGNAAVATQNGGNAMGDAIGTAAGIAGRAVTDNFSGISNFFGGL